MQLRTAFQRIWILFSLSCLASLLQLNIKHESWILHFSEAIATNPNYAYRILYPTLISLTPLAPIHALLLWNIIFWTIGSNILYWNLRGMGFSYKRSLIGASMPLLNFSTFITGFYTPDGMNFIIVSATFLILRKFREDPIHILWLPFLAGLWIMNDFPVPAPDQQPLLYGLRTLLTLLPYLPFILMGLRLPKTDWEKLNIILISIVICVCILATDWDRWAVLASTIWTPYALRGLGDETIES